jgi:hypothetical protein
LVGPVADLHTHNAYNGAVPRAQVKSINRALRRASVTTLSTANLAAVVAKHNNGDGDVGGGGGGGGSEIAVSASVDALVTSQIEAAAELVNIEVEAAAAAAASQLPAVVATTPRQTPHKYGGGGGDGGDGDDVLGLRDYLRLRAGKELEQSVKLVSPWRPPAANRTPRKGEKVMRIGGGGGGGEVTARRTPTMTSPTMPPTPPTFTMHGRGGGMNSSGGYSSTQRVPRPSPSLPRFPTFSEQVESI